MPCMCWQCSSTIMVKAGLLVLQCGTEEPWQIHFTSLGDNDLPAATSAARSLMEALNDPLEKEKKAHTDLNKLRTRFAGYDTSIAKLPPCEASFAEKWKRAMLQTKISMLAHIAKPQIGSPLQHGWKIENMPDGSYLVPVLFQSPMTSELLDSLLCACGGKTHTCKTCICKEHNLGFTSCIPVMVVMVVTILIHIGMPLMTIHMWLMRMV